MFCRKECRHEPPRKTHFLLCIGAIEGPHGHVGGDGVPQGEGGDGFGGEVGHVEGLGALEGPHGHVGGDGGPQGEGGPQV